MLVKENRRRHLNVKDMTRNHRYSDWIEIETFTHKFGRNSQPAPYSLKMSENVYHRLCPTQCIFHKGRLNFIYQKQRQTKNGTSHFASGEFFSYSLHPDHSTRTDPDETNIHVTRLLENCDRSIHGGFSQNSL